MVRISDILRRGRDEEEPRKKKSKDQAKEKKISEKVTKEVEKKKAPEKIKEEVRKEIPTEVTAQRTEKTEEKDAASHIEIARVVMEKTKAGRPKSEEIYQELTRLMETILAKVEGKRPIAGREIVLKVDRAIDQIGLASDELLELTNRTTPENYLFTHAVNVCLLSIKLGFGLGFNKSRLSELGVSVLLNDIDITEVTDMLQRPSDEEISENARIIAVVDTYEALIHPQSNRDRLLPHEALKEILRDKDKFDQRFIKVLIEEVGIYPVGSWVELNTGEVGKVAKINKGFPLQPTVNVVADPDGHKLQEIKPVELARQATIYIKRSLSDNELKSKLTE